MPQSLPSRSHKGAKTGATNRDATDYAHRTFVNLAATAVLLFVAVCIVWTVRAIETQEKLQRCLASGRRDCVDIGGPARPPMPMPLVRSNAR